MNARTSFGVGKKEHIQSPDSEERAQLETAPVVTALPIFVTGLRNSNVGESTDHLFEAFVAFEFFYVSGDPPTCAFSLW